MIPFKRDDTVWYDVGLGHPSPGIVAEVLADEDAILLYPDCPDNCETLSKVKVTELKKVKLRMITLPHEVENLVTIGELSDPAIMWVLKTRYEKEIYHTNLGKMLVTLNPNNDMIKGSVGSNEGLMQFDERLYQKIIANREKNQLIMINGETNSGKSETLKAMLKHLAAISPKLVEKRVKTQQPFNCDKITAALTVLESFGCAKTPRNDNSTRLSNLIEVHYKQGCIVGAQTTESLLEKNRIVYQAQHERNFNVFYEMMKGLKFESKEKFGLTSANKYFYLNQGNCTDFDSGEENEKFKLLQSAFAMLGFTNDQLHTIWRILAAILHLGNVYFHKCPMANNVEGVRVGNEGEVKWVGYLLQLDSARLFQLLTTREVENGEKPLNIDQALDLRDAIAKVLFEQIFKWICNRMNHSLKPLQKDSTIAIFDAFGFENFKANSLEQLIVNYANEKFHNFYFNQNFKDEQAEYTKDKLSWEDQIGKKVDNQVVLDLLGKRPCGLLPVIDDETNFPKGSDDSMLLKCNYNHIDNSTYGKPRKTADFCVKHRGGSVVYQVPGFIEKNRDILPDSIGNLFEESQNLVISQMFKQSKRENSGKAKFRTVISQINEDLAAVMHRLESFTCVNFIRCLKANNVGQANHFDKSVVFDQVKSLGLLETIRIKKMGFPAKYDFKTFVQRYRCLVQSDMITDKTDKESAYLILNKQGYDNSEKYQLGETKVFLRDDFHDMLESSRETAVAAATLQVQRHIRGYLARKKYRTARNSAIKIQSGVRGWRARKRYQLRQKIHKSEAGRRSHSSTPPKDPVRTRSRLDVFDNSVVNANIAVGAVNHLDVPRELENILLQSKGPTDNYGQVVKAVGNIIPHGVQFTLPYDLNSHTFSSFAQANFKGHEWRMRREPIKTPFLDKLTEDDFQASLMLFKLILRFMNDTTQTRRSEIILGNYIVQKGLDNEDLRDEIFCQLVNQTHQNPNAANCERGWMLLAACVSCFRPSLTLRKPLLNYTENAVGNEPLRGLAMAKLQMGIHTEGSASRKYPLTQMEWMGITGKGTLALKTKFPCGPSVNSQVESWTSAEDFASKILQDKGVKHTRGWSAVLKAPGVDYMMAGNDYLLDCISHVENSLMIPRASGNLPCLTAPNSKPRPEERRYSNPEDPGVLPISHSALNKRYNKAEPHIRSYSSVQNIRAEVPKDQTPKLARRQASIDNLVSSNQPASQAEIKIELEAENAYRAISSSKKVVETKTIDTDIPSPPKMPIKEFTKINYAPVPVSNMSYGSSTGMRFRSGPIPLSIAPKVPNEPFYAPISQNHSEIGYGGKLPSEYSAYSMASHIRGVQTPSKNSDVDKFLDDLFEPVLKDSTLEEIYERNSIRSQIKGGADEGDKGVATVQEHSYQGMMSQAQMPMIMMVPMPTEGMKYSNMSHMQAVMMPQMMGSSFSTFQPAMMPMCMPMSGAGVPQMPMQFMQVPMGMGMSPHYFPMQQMGAMQMANNMYQMNSDGQTYGMTTVNVSNEMPPEPKYPAPFPTVGRMKGQEGQGKSVRINSEAHMSPFIDTTASKGVDRESDSELRPNGNLFVGQLKATSDSARYAPQASPTSDPEWPRDISDRHPSQVGHEIRDTIAKLRGNSPKTPDPTEIAIESRAAEFRFGDSLKRPVVKPISLELEQQRLQAEALERIKAKASGLPPPLDAVMLMRQKAAASQRRPEVDVTTREAAQRNEQIRPDLLTPEEMTPPPPPPVPMEPAQMQMSPDAAAQYRTAPFPVPIRADDFLPPEPQSFRPYCPPESEFPPMPMPDDSDWIREDEDDLIDRKVRQFIKQKKTDPRRSAVSPDSEFSGESPKQQVGEGKKDGKRRGPVYTYNDAVWDLELRKEIFFPEENLDDPVAVDAIFLQVVNEVYDGNPFRIRRDERKQMCKLLESYGVYPGDQLETVMSNLGFEQKRHVIEVARGWPLYFSRLYPVVEARDSEYVASVLGVHESGVRLIARNYEAIEEPFKILDYFSFEDVRVLKAPEPDVLILQTVNGIVIKLYSDKVDQIKAIVEEFQYGPGQGKQYVRATADYITKEPNLLSFHKDDVIQLVNNVQTDSLGTGWLYGKVNGQYGNFPKEYIQEIPTDFGEIGISATFDDFGEDPEMQQRQEKLTMMEFAMLYFRQTHPNKYEIMKSKDGTLKGTLNANSDRKSEAEWTWREIAELVKFSKTPIQASLLKLENQEYNRLAVESFMLVMQYMGDYPLRKNQQYSDCINQILTICHQQPPMRDEIYCQIMKQTTNNKSPKTESAVRGWRLFSIITSYFDCSEVLKPYLVKYLSDAASDNRRAYHGTAAVCLLNLRKTFKFGGRKFLLSSKEIDAVSNGKNLKRQIYHLPGGAKKVINTKSVTVVEEIIQELCQELNVLSPLEQQEFCLCYVVESDNVMKLLSNDEYILDITTDLEGKNLLYFLLLKRTVWIHPLRLDNELYIDVMFFQVVPDYLEGLLVIMRSAESLSAAILDDVAMLGALLHKSDDSADSELVTEKSVSSVLPRITQNVRSIGQEQWADRVNSKLKVLPLTITKNQARAKFLDILQNWPLFGSTFFYITTVSDVRVQGECLLAVNKLGLQFIDIITHETMMEFRLTEIISTHKISASSMPGSPTQFLDIKVGNLIQQDIITLQTDQGAEISRLLGQYIYVDSQNRGFIAMDKRNTNGH